MNPTTAAPLTGPKTLTDIARPPVESTPAASPSPQSATAMTTNIVNNIPMHAPAQPAKPLANEDEDLDVLMKDIGHELRQADRKTTKKHFSLFARKHKAPAAKPLLQTKPDHPAAVATPVPRPAVPTHQAHLATAGVAKPKQPKVSSAPIGVIFITVLVTGVLIAAAIYSYK